MLNKIIMMGRLTAAPELKQTPSGVSVTTFSIAVDDDFKGENGEKQTDFFDIVAWRGNAEFIARNFRKGQLITITGRLTNQKWTDRDGNNRKTTKIVADNSYFCGDYGDRTPAQPQQNPQTTTNASPAQSQPQQMRMPYNPYTDQYTPPVNPQPFQPQSDDDLPF